MIIQPGKIKKDEYGEYCRDCFSQNLLKRLDIQGRNHYFCRDCNHQEERSLIIDPKVVWYLDGTNCYWHETVGIFLFNANNELLLFQRIIYPEAVTVPAGHLDKDRELESMALQELKEETGIVLNSLQFFVKKAIDNDSCRRGCDHHVWHVFVGRVYNYSATQIRINEEGTEAQWQTIENALSMNLTVPVRFILQEYSDQLYIS